MTITPMSADFVGSNTVDEFETERGHVSVTAFAANHPDTTGGREVRAVELSVGDLDVSIPLGSVDRVIAAMREAQVAASQLDLG